MDKVATFDSYQEKVMAAKDAAVIYGLNSEQYKNAIEQMQQTYKSVSKPISYKVINFISKLSWQTKHRKL